MVEFYHRPLTASFHHLNSREKDDGQGKLIYPAPWKQQVELRMFLKGEFRRKTDETKETISLIRSQRSYIFPGYSRKTFLCNLSNIVKVAQSALSTSTSDRERSFWCNTYRD